MNIKSIELRNFMKWRGAWRLNGFQDGVNKLIEENEFGKSTILEALRGVLQYRYSSKTAHDEFKCALVEGEHPEVTVVFDIDGVEWRLYKKFAKQSGRATLEGDGKPFAQDAAEDELERLLGLKSSGRTNMVGALGALWVKQTASISGPELDEAARASIGSTIEAQVGTVTGGERGRRILTKIREELADRVGKSNAAVGVFKKLKNEVEDARDAIRRKREDAASFEDEAKRLETLTAELQNPDNQSEINDLKVEIRAADENVRIVAQAESAYAIAKSTHENARLTLQMALDARQERARQKTLVDDTGENHLAVADRARSAEQELRDQEDSFAAFEKALAESNEAVKNAANDLGRATTAMSVAVASADLGRVTDLLRKAEAHEAKISAAEAKVRANPITEKVLQDLSTLSRKAEETKAVLLAGAPEVEILIEAGATVTVDGKKITAGQVSQKAIEPLRIKGDGLEIVVRPAITADRENLKSTAKAALEKFEAALRKFGAASVIAASEEAGKRRSDEAEIKGLKAELAGILSSGAPQDAEEGVAGLREYIGAKTEEVNRALTFLGLTEAPDRVAAADAGEIIKQAHRDAEKKQAKNEALVKAATSTLANARAKLAEAKAEETRMDRELALAASQLKSMREKESDEGLEDRIRVAEQQVSAAEAALAATPEVDLEGAKTKLARLQSALEEREKRLRKLETDHLTVKTAISVRWGVGESLADLEAHGAELENRLRRMEEEVAVSLLLQDVLGASERAAKERYVAPVKDKVMAHLKRLLPGAEAEVSEDMSIDGLLRDGVKEGIERLSTGTREQLAVLVRLAFAQILAERNMPAMLILDDALVYSDDRRLDEMCAILHDAARNLQIVILSCHGRMWSKLPGELLTMERVTA